MGSNLYRHTLDDKARLSIPIYFRNMLGDSFTITKGIREKCLYLFSLSEWEKLKEKFKAQKLMDDKARRFERFFVGGSCDCTIDKQGRINIPIELRDYAQIKKDVVITGLTSRIEIWDSENWRIEVESFDPDTDMVIDI
jgi:MraZ protein